MEKLSVELTKGKAQQRVTEIVKRRVWSTKHSFVPIRLPTCTCMTLCMSQMRMLIGNGCRSEALTGAAAA